jgi:hypothetical protein
MNKSIVIRPSSLLFFANLGICLLLTACSYTKALGTIQQGSDVGGTGNIGFTHEPLGANKHLLSVTASPGLMETEGSIYQRIHIFSMKFAAKTCPSKFEFVHDPNFSQASAAGFMKRGRTYVFECNG